MSTTEENLTSEYPDSYMFNNWENLENIDEKILRGIYSYGFEQPSVIQQKAIKPIIMGKDIIAQAQAGTGKTGAFTIGALSRINVNEKTNQVLILAPTRELTLQIAHVITSIGSQMEGLVVKTLVGGSSIDEDVSSIRANTPHVIVGTPGRVFDMMRRNHIRGKAFKLAILDEADEMLSSGFKDQVYNIFQHFNNNIQVALFSATLPEHIFAITNKIMRNPVRINVAAEKLTLEGIQQFYIGVNDDRQKYDVIKDLFASLSVTQTFIYCNSVRRVVDLYDAMKEDGYPVACIHSNMDKIERENALKEFRTGSTRIMISTNVTARGIDIQQVSVVINFDIPKDVHTYIHRIGRSGRWGRKGTGINLVTRRDQYNLKAIETFYHCNIEEFPANYNF
jgi:translation initiation factor 4A